MWWTRYYEMGKPKEPDAAKKKKKKKKKTVTLYFITGFPGSEISKEMKQNKIVS